jgi:hypothetical protein
VKTALYLLGIMFSSLLLYFSNISAIVCWIVLSWASSLIIGYWVKKRQVIYSFVFNISTMLITLEIHRVLEKTEFERPQSGTVIIGAIVILSIVNAQFARITIRKKDAESPDEGKTDTNANSFGPDANDANDREMDRNPYVPPGAKGGK